MQNWDRSLLNTTIYMYSEYVYLIMPRLTEGRFLFWGCFFTNIRSLLFVIMSFTWNRKHNSNGIITLPDTETDTKTNKNGLCRIVWRCSYCTEMLTQIPIGFSICLDPYLFAEKWKCTTSTLIKLNIHTWTFNQTHFPTRKHSSRMRTIRCSGRPGGVSGRHPPVNRMTDRQM